MTHARKSVLKDIIQVADRMREADVAEVMAAEGKFPREVLLQCFFTSQPCMTIVDDDDVPVAMFGVAPLTEKLGGVWMLGTNELVQNPRTRLRFLREARQHLEGLHRLYPLLGNMVDARNRIHIRWLRWMGFKFLRIHAHWGAEGRPFLEFCRLSPCAPRS